MFSNYNVKNICINPLVFFKQETMQSRESYKYHKLPENKPNRINLYEDEQDQIAIKQTDSHELKDIKGKMKIVIGKLAQAKKDKDKIQKENDSLKVEVMNLQNSLRHMVAGFNNSSGNFPIPNQLSAKIAQFYKYDCLDLFFDLLCPEELTMKGVIYFYHQSFIEVHKLVDEYFQPCLDMIKQTGCFDSIEGPIMNVLRKAFQSRYQKIIENILKESRISNLASQIRQSLNLPQESLQSICQFLTKLTEIVCECKISDPPFLIDLNNIGKRVQYNTLINDPFDGFIKPKEECFIILPQVRKIQNQECITKSLVLQKNYDIGN